MAPTAIASRSTARRLEQEVAWLERYRQQWNERFDELARVVAEGVAAEVKRSKKTKTKTKKTKTKVSTAR